jgi:hypothetical protein
MRRAPPLPSSSSTTTTTGNNEFIKKIVNINSGSRSMLIGGRVVPNKVLTCAVIAVLFLYAGLAAFFTVGMVTGSNQDRTIPGLLLGGSSTSNNKGTDKHGEIENPPPPPPPPPEDDTNQHNNHIITESNIINPSTNNQRKKIHPNDDIHIVFSTGCSMFVQLYIIQITLTKLTPCFLPPLSFLFLVLLIKQTTSNIGKPKYYYILIGPQVNVVKLVV